MSGKRQGCLLLPAEAFIRWLCLVQLRNLAKLVKVLSTSKSTFISPNFQRNEFCLLATHRPWKLLLTLFTQSCPFNFFYFILLYELNHDKRKDITFKIFLILAFIRFFLFSYIFMDIFVLCCFWRYKMTSYYLRLSELCSL